MTKLTKIIYYLKMFLFITHFYVIFIMLKNILDTGFFGYLFLLIYFTYIIMVIMQLLSKKKKYQNDTIYNIMQVGFVSYILVIAINILVNKIYVTKLTYPYFKNNYLIASLLLIFIIGYNLMSVIGNKK